MNNNEKNTMPVKTEWTYIVYREECYALDSGTDIYDDVYTKDLNKAFELLKEKGRNSIKRKMKVGSAIKTQWYDFETKSWCNY